MQKNDVINNGMLKVIEAFFGKYNSKHDIHYKEGFGAIIVPYNYPLLPQHIVTVISEGDLLRIGKGMRFSI